MQNHTEQNHTDPWFNAQTHLVEIAPVNLTDVDRLGALMVHHLPAGVVVGLVGTLGAGKTRLVQGIAKAAGIDAADVTSPTFTLLQTHHGSPVIHHLDAYRIADEDEFIELGVDELFDDSDAWTLIEWADRVSSSMPIDTVWLRILIAPESGQRESEQRRIQFSDPSGNHSNSLQMIRKEFESEPKSSLSDQ